MAKIPTVTVVGESGDALIINESDYDSKVHTLYEETPNEELVESDRIIDAETGNYAEKGSGGWYEFFSTTGERIDTPRKRKGDVADAFEALR